MNPVRRVAIALEMEKPYTHHQELFTGIQQYANEHAQWECVLDEHPGLMQGGDNAKPGYDGVLARASQVLVRRLRPHQIPVVNVWYQQNRPGLPGVFVDPKQVGRLAAEHLMERGFRRLSCLVNPGRSYFKAMYSSFESCAVEEGAECLRHEFPAGDYQDPKYWMSLKKDFDDWLDQLTLPVGLYVEVPQDVRILIDLCRARGWRVPQDVALLCQANTKSVVENPPPQISCIDMNFHRVGYEAAALLDRLMDGEQPPAQPVLLPPKNVIARESTDYFAVEDEVVAEALRYIASHLSDQLTLDRIAAELAVSPRSLQLRFDAALGRSISDEIRRLRLQAAKRLLGDSDRQIAEIAQFTGLGSSSHLCRLFQKQIGLTPSAYRKQILGKRKGQLP